MNIVDKVERTADSEDESKLLPAFAAPYLRGTPTLFNVAHTFRTIHPNRAWPGDPFTGRERRSHVRVPSHFRKPAPTKDYR